MAFGKKAMGGYITDSKHMSETIEGMLSDTYGEERSALIAEKALQPESRRTAELPIGGFLASMPLIENQVIGYYGWMTYGKFRKVLASENSLPGAITTKLAGCSVINNEDSRNL
ncbi:MAG TPA: chromate transporter [Bacillales bacterium]